MSAGSLRMQIAVEAARLLYSQSEADLHRARQRAALRVGRGNARARHLPSKGEIARELGSLIDSEHARERDAVWDHRLEAMARACLRKPGPPWQRAALGLGCSFEMHGEPLWVWRVDVEALTDYLQTRGLHPTHRIAGECTQLQRRLGGRLRRGLLRLNNAWFRLGLPAACASTNLLVFEKAGSDRVVG